MMEEKFSLLCGTFEKKNYIYAVKFAKHPWYYFEMEDSYSCKHRSLPASMNSLIRQLKKVRSIDLQLNEEQIQNYFKDEKFIFNNKELKTYMDLNCKTKKHPRESQLSTNRLLFISGQTNPLLFLKKFERCSDVETDKNKMYKIRGFVDESHKAEFTKLYFESNWSTVRSTFLEKYSLPFMSKQKRELQIDFKTETSLRSFFEQKLKTLAKFTTLPFINQVEMVLTDLPVEISTLFITNEKMTGSKESILEFCDSIHEFVDTIIETQPVEGLSNESSNEPEPLKRLEVFQISDHFENSEPSNANQPGPSGVVRRKAIAIQRPSKKLKSILESDASSDYDFMTEVDASSRSSWSN